MNRSEASPRRRLVLFGDQTSNVSSIAQRLLLSAPHSAAASEFLRDANAALMAQKSSLRPFQRTDLPDFRSLHDIARIYEEAGGVCHPSIASVLLCATQLLQLFRYFEEDRPVPNQDEDVTAVGLCTGSLAAAAFAASNGVEDLRCLAVPTVSMAFQIGLEATTASSLIYEQEPSKLGSWSVAIPNMTEEEATSALSMFDVDHNSSLRRRCFVSAVGLKSVTISGAPPALKAFTDSLITSLPEQRVIELPVFAAFHAMHIHRLLDFPSFLSRCGVGLPLLARFKPVRHLLSPLTGEPVLANDAFGLFQTAICETLQAPLRLDRIVDGFTRAVRNGGVSNVVVEAVSPTNVADGIVGAASLTQASISSRPLVALASTGELRSNPSFNNAPLAIVGMSGRFPDADTAEALWDLLARKVDAHRFVPKDRFDVDIHVDPSGKVKNTSWTPYGCFIDRPGEFDPKFFNMSPKEALQTDPMQRLALLTAYEALEQAGFVPDRTPSSASHRVGTFYGQTIDEYRDVNSSQDIGIYYVTGGIRAFGPGRINYFFKFSGPSYSVDTACSSSLAAIQLACTAIWNGECDTAVAGGLSVLTSPDLFSGLSRGQFLSKTGSCKTFDNTADGYCRADGIGTVVIKRLKDAEGDRDHVFATILGAGTNHSAHAVSITHPHAETQSDLYRQVLHQAGVHPFDVSYVEMHGTGTQAGDVIEMKSVSDVCAPPAPKARPRESPLYVGAVKANIGHGGAASGVISLIKAMTILKKSLIPPHAGIKGKLNVGFPDLEERNIHIAMRMTPFPEKQGVKKTILVNNFSAAGGNTVLLIQEPPATRLEQDKEPRDKHPVTVSGHTQSALLNNLDRLIAFLESNSDASPLDLSYTTTARRRHHTFRTTVVESSTSRILAALKQKRSSLAQDSIPTKKSTSAVFVFTGQGSAYPALAREIYNTSAQFRADISHFDAIAHQQGFPTFLPLITDTTLSDTSALSPIQVQIGLVCIQVALARLWSSFGIKPSAVVGHSLGEYAALQVAGVISVSDMILLVGSRAQLMESKCERDSHAMLAVAAPGSSVLSRAPECLDGIDLACSNSPRESVFAGERTKIEKLAKKLDEEKIRSTQLRVPYAFHSAQVDRISEDFGHIASIVQMNVPHIQFISPTRGRVLNADDKIDAEYLEHHCRHTVQFAQAIAHGREAGVITDATIFIEVGPHPACSAMIKSILGDTVQTLPTLHRKETPWNVVVATLATLHDAGLPVNWSEYQKDVESACRLIHLPSYAFDNKNYWIEYRNNWTLRKGDPVPVTGAQTTITKSCDNTKPHISSSVHRVREQDFSSAQPRAIFETDLSHLDIHTAVSGHRVNNSALCPSSVYADIALTIARYLRNQPQSGLDQDGHDVCDMEVTQPLIINPYRDEENRTLRILVHIDKQGQQLSLEYSSYSTTPETSMRHAVCRVQYGDPRKWSRRWAHDLHMVKDRIVALKAAANTGKASSITRQLAYRLFASLVDYTEDFRRMRQVWLDAPGLEAAAVVSLEKREADANFVFSPYHLDSLLHISGFIMNGNDTIDASEAVYISHGWESIRLTEPLVPDANYDVYVKMLPVDKTMVAGNVYIIHGEKVVGLCEAIRFQRVPRAVLNILLPPTPPTQSGHPGQPAIVAPERFKANLPSVRAPERPSVSPKHKQWPSASGRPTISSATRSTQAELLMQVISDEVGVSRGELKTTDSLSDLGVDSLMSLALAGQLAEKFGVSVDHSELMQCQDVNDLLNLLGSTREAPVFMLDEESPRSHSSRSGVSFSASLGTVTPPTETTTPAPKSSNSVTELIYSVILSETGLDEEELQPSAELSYLGVDSLMNLAILAKLREAGLELSPTFFLDNRTLDDVFRAVGKGEEDPVADQGQTVDSTVSQTPKLRSKAAAVDTQPYVQCILLQKVLRQSSGRSLFLIPDGSGSPSAYAALERIHPALNVYGLVCPFLKAPAAMGEYGIEGTAAEYVKTVLEKCPTGPIHIGGWSAGGALAFEAAKQLMDVHGRDVANLLLIDAPCPLTLPPMNAKLIQVLDSLQMFFPLGDKGLPARVDTEKHRMTLDHFDATVDILGRYKPAPAREAIRTLVVWARSSVVEGGHAIPDRALLDDPIGRWMLQDRGDLGSHGWDELLPKGSLEIVTVPGNHFSMMTGENIQALSCSLQAHFRALSGQV